jgi:hypothetical protein
MNASTFIGTMAHPIRNMGTNRESTNRLLNGTLVPEIILAPPYPGQWGMTATLCNPFTHLLRILQ